MWLACCHSPTLASRFAGRCRCTCSRSATVHSQNTLVSSWNTSRGDTIRGDATRGDAIRGDAIRGDAIWGDAIRGDTIRGDTIRGDTIRGDTRGRQPFWACSRTIMRIIILH
jgi:hypothetical protein